MQAILGLPNDILGWEKDYTADNPRNAVEILIKGGQKTSTAFEDVLTSHNGLVQFSVHLATAHEIGSWISRQRGLETHNENWHLY
jgi:hypothetical protein